jgi:hypothetical protein
VQHAVTDIPLFYLTGTSANAYNGGIRDIALIWNGFGGTVGTGYSAEQAPQEFISNVYVAGFNKGFNQGQNSWGWHVVKTICRDASICWYAHDEGEDSTYTSNTWRSYRATGTAYQSNNMGQANLFLGDDFSDNLWGVLLTQGDTNGNGTGTPYPMEATFINGQFEDNINAAIAVLSSNQSAAASLHPQVTAIGCRAYISGTFAGATPNNGESFIYAQHAAGITVSDLTSSGYSYGAMLGQSGYTFTFSGTSPGPTTWSQDLGAVYGTSRFIGQINNVTQLGANKPLARLNSGALSYVASNYTRIPMTVVVNDSYGWFSSSNQGLIPTRAGQMTRFAGSMSVTSALAGRYTLQLYKNGASFCTMNDTTIGGTQSLLIKGECYDTPNGTDYYNLLVYATQSFTLDTTPQVTYFYAGLEGT